MKWLLLTGMLQCFLFFFLQVEEAPPSEPAQAPAVSSCGTLDYLNIFHFFHSIEKYECLANRQM